jgi:DNA-binding PadR family transcriptional regulator
LLAEKPSHGYELIKALEERSGGFYCPSPGMVYPMLLGLGLQAVLLLLIAGVFLYT